MKYLIVTFSFVFLLHLSNAYGQHKNGSGVKKRSRTGIVQEAEKHKTDTIHIEDEVQKLSNGKGNAHGRNKGELAGSEFGHKRANEAKSHKERKKMEMDEALKNGEEQVNTAKEKIEASKRKLKSQKEKGLINKEETEKWENDINAAEEEVYRLEKKIKDANNKANLLNENKEEKLSGDGLNNDYEDSVLNKHNSGEQSKSIKKSEDKIKL